MKEIIKVVAKDSQEDERLSQEYRAFLGQYEHHDERRRTRREQIAEKLSGLRTVKVEHE